MRLMRCASVVAAAACWSRRQREPSSRAHSSRSERCSVEQTWQYVDRRPCRSVFAPRDRDL